MSGLSESDLAKTELALDKYDSEESLRKFVERGWHVLHPGIEETFVGGYCLDAICDHLQGVSDGFFRKLIINVPPGCTKSMTTAVFWPAWEWGPRYRPERKFLDGAYTQDLTVRDNRRFRNLITSDWYTHNWGDCFSLSGDQNEKKKVENDRTGWKIATSVGGAATGERGNVFIIDDPHNVKDSESDAKRESALFWLTEVVPTRMVNYKTGVFVLIMQRIHEKDCTSVLEEQGYMHLRLPMEYEKEEKCITYAKHPRTSEEFRFADWREEEDELLWPERMPREVIDDLKTNMTPYAVAAQLQQRPSPRGGGMVKRHWLKVVSAAPAGLESVRGWDIADTASMTAAYTAGVKIGRSYDGDFYIEDAIRFQEEDSYKSIRNIASQDGLDTEIDIPQDPGAAGKFVARYIKKHLAGFKVKSSPESGDKASRLTPFADQAEAGNVYLVQGDWNEAYLNELTKFPYSATKDFSDATSRAFARLAMKPMEDGDSIGTPEAFT